MRRNITVMHCKRKSSLRRGVAAVEMAICAPIIILLLAGVWELGRMLEVQQVIANAAREGGRQASNGTLSYDQVRSAVVTYLTNNGIKAATLEDVKLENLTDPARKEPTSANQLDQFRVTVTISVDKIRWSWLQQLSTITTLSAKADWYSMRDIPITVAADIPLN